MEFRRRKDNFTPKRRITQEEASSWDVVVLSFKLLIQRIQFWIQANIWGVLFSAAIVTGPAAKAAIHQAIASGLHDPGGSEVKVFPEMKAGFQRNFWKGLLISLIKWFMFAIITLSIYFWISQDTWGLRFISVVSIYGLVMWWLSVGYINPILIENPDNKALEVLREAVVLAFKKPFQSLLFAVVSSLLLLFGLILLGPVMLIIPVLRAIIMTQGYWFVTGKEVPGFMEIYEYIQKKELD